MVQVDALDYSHLAVFRGVIGIAFWLPTSPGKPDDDDRQVPGMWLDYGASMGHAGFVVERVNGRKLPNRLQPKPGEFAMLQ
jgi:hypothetical protein